MLILQARAVVKQRKAAHALSAQASAEKEADSLTAACGSDSPGDGPGQLGVIQVSSSWNLYIYF